MSKTYLKTAPFPLFFAFVCLAIGAWGVLDVYERKGFFKTAERTDGTVREFICQSVERGFNRPGSGSGSRCMALVAVDIRGKTFQVPVMKRSSPGFRSGSIAEIAYRIDSLGGIDARLVESAFRVNNVMPMMFGTGGFLMCALATYLLITTSPEWRKRMRRKARRKRNAT
jgi:hypothetical protein